jgi:hypothetical protein
VADKFDLEISGAGNVRMDLKVQNLQVDMSGAGNIELRGTARVQDVQMSGAGNYNGFELKSEKAKVDMSGVGNVRVYVTKELNASASGVGAVRYKGNPESITKNSSSFLGSIKAGRLTMNAWHTPSVCHAFIFKFPHFQISSSLFCLLLPHARQIHAAGCFRFQRRRAPGHPPPGQRFVSQSFLQNSARPAGQRSGLLQHYACRWRRY